MPSNHGRSLCAQWSLCRTTGLLSKQICGISCRRVGVICEEHYLHAVGFCDRSDVVGSGDSPGDRGLLFVVGEALTGKVGTASLRDLEDDRRLDVSIDFYQYCFAIERKLGVTVRLRGLRWPWTKKLRSEGRLGMDGLEWDRV